MGSVDEADVEKQERSEVQERWADNIVQAESNSDSPAEPKAATPDAAPQQATETAPAPDSASASAAAAVRPTVTAFNALRHDRPSVG